MPFAIFLLQIAAILCVTMLCGWIAKRLGQPRVVGHIAGGILLGPIGLGHIAAWAQLFSAKHLAGLEIVSNIGLVLFLFLIGAELDLRALRSGLRSTALITAGSVVAPAMLGLAILAPLRAHFGTAHGAGFAIFVPIALSITALPVLAQILKEQTGIAADVASYALLSAAINDVLVWSVLAVSLTLLHGSSMHAALLPLFWLLLFTATMLGVVRPLAASIAGRSRSQWPILLCFLPLAFLSAHITDLLGIHAFFGAFLTGLCLPRSVSHAQTERTLRPMIVTALPVFFALTGIKMQSSMLRLDGLQWLALIVAVAVVGKVAGGTLAARVSGMPWTAARQMGILLNTRGLVELIVLNIAYREGIFNTSLFTLFVLMALVTTAMTKPLLRLTLPRSTLGA